VKKTPPLNWFRESYVLFMIHIPSKVGKPFFDYLENRRETQQTFPLCPVESRAALDLSAKGPILKNRPGRTRPEKEDSVK